MFVLRLNCYSRLFLHDEMEWYLHIFVMYVPTNFSHHPGTGSC